MSNFDNFDFVQMSSKFACFGFHNSLTFLNSLSVYTFLAILPGFFLFLITIIFLLCLDLLLVNLRPSWRWEKPVSPTSWSHGSLETDAEKLAIKVLRTITTKYPERLYQLIPRRMAAVFAAQGGHTKYWESFLTYIWTYTVNKLTYLWQATNVFS